MSVKVKENIIQISYMLMVPFSHACTPSLP
jgi:hypothetical protein